MKIMTTTTAQLGYSGMTWDSLLAITSGCKRPHACHHRIMPDLDVSEDDADPDDALQ